MQVAITGASGLIGSALADSLRSDGHQVLAISRAPKDADGIRWDPSAGTIDASRLEGIDAVVHLAGQPIAARPWTSAQRRAIAESRRTGTDLIARTLAGLDAPPAVLVSGSAIGAYGDRGEEVLTEASSLGHDFLADVCRDWEQATAPAAEAGIRVVTIRTGIVLAASGGALGAQLPIFKLGLGGKAGNGRQWMPWITIDDEVGAIRFLLDHADVSGPVNLVSPEPVTNAAFTKAVGRALHRPTILNVPRAIRHLPLGIGDLAGSLLFSSARVVPEVLIDAGYTYRHTDLDEAMRSVLGNR